jgi:DNA polymerase-3 subunit gamma/tau
LLSLDEKTELDLNAAQKIFGYFDKSQLINLFELILRGEEKKLLISIEKFMIRELSQKYLLMIF